MPLENSLEGSVALTLDMLAHKVDLKMAAELSSPPPLPAGTPGTDFKPNSKGDIASSGIGPVSGLSTKAYTQGELIAASSTAEAARLVASANGLIAAIGTTTARRCIWAFHLGIGCTGQPR